MAYIGTRIRLYAAQVNANAMGLERTAGRFKVLRGQLNRHKNLSDPERRENLKWAIAKLQDTQKNIEVEADTLGATSEFYDKMANSCLANRMLKFAGVVISLTFMNPYIREILTQVSSHSKIFGVIAATAGLVAASWHMIDRFFSRDLEDCMHNLNTVVERSIRTLEYGLAEFKDTEAVPVEKEEKK